MNELSKHFPLANSTRTRSVPEAYAPDRPPSEINEPDMFDLEATQREFDETQQLYARAHADIAQAESEQDWDERETELYDLSRRLRVLKARLDAASC